VRDLLYSRLSGVDEAGRQLLQAAAVIGRSFDLETLREVSGRGEDETVAALDDLVARGLLAEVRGPATGLPPKGGATPTHDFAHEKLRALLYEDTSLGRRRVLHRRVAEALVGRARLRREVGPLSSQTAHHYHLAGQDELAAGYFRQAGEHARALYANAEALEHFRTALALGHPEAAALHEAIGDLQTLLGEYAGALASYETAAALGGPDQLASVEHRAGSVHQRRGEWELAESHFQASLAALGETAPAAERASVYADWSLSAHHLGRQDDSEDRARRALALAEVAGDARALAEAHNILGILASSRDDLETARAHLESSLEHAQAMGYPSARAAALNNLALVCASEGDLDRALHLAAEALAICVSLGDRHREAALHNNLADLLHAAGQVDAAMGHVKQAVAIYADIGVEAGQVRPEIWKLSEW
jgi:predicted ATPase